jgi:hypothetical protein
MDLGTTEVKVGAEEIAASSQEWRKTVMKLLAVSRYKIQLIIRGGGKGRT